MPSSDIETRHVEAELRIASRDGARVITGYPIMFNVLSLNLGGFREIIKPEAIQRTLDENIDLRALFDHDTGKLLGRKSAGTLRVKAEAKGLYMEIDPPNTTAGRDTVESIQRGDLSGASFAFRVMPDGDDWEMIDEMPVRTVLDMRVLEVSPVTFPAYPQTEVEVGTRSAGIDAALASLARWKERAPPPEPYRPSLALLEARQRQARG